jgi:hypothetical protein
VSLRPDEQREFHALLDEYAGESEVDRGDAPLTLARLGGLERQKGVKFPAFYKEFLSMYGAGDFGLITVLSPDPKSQFPIWKQRRSWKIESLISWE